MFAVKPVYDAELHRELCEALGAEYTDGTLAYFAAELADDRSSVTELIGICCFSVGEEAKIYTLFPAEGKEEDEAMIIMCRAVMNFLWRTGTKILTIPLSAGPETLLKKCGLRECENGYTVDLDEFYLSPCHYNPNEDSNDNI